MKEIIKNEEFNIYRDNRKETLYKIIFSSISTTNISLLNSIIKTNIILGSTITEDYKSITFQALSVKTLPQYLLYLKKTQENNTLDINKSLNMIYYLSNQLKYLINNEGKCFYRYNPHNVLIIDETKFIYLSNEDLLKIKPETENIEINTIISLDWFISPEILKINSIPEIVNYRTIYYSLSALIIYSLYSVNILDILNDEDKVNDEKVNDDKVNDDKVNDDKVNDDKVNDNIDEILNNLKGTKLYYFLKRCLNKTIENRRLIYF